jgi:hypothetical protein
MTDPDTTARIKEAAMRIAKSAPALTPEVRHQLAAVMRSPKSKRPDKAA